ncbi:MAG: hypothetical protein M3N52_04055 [Actinomycetota bacterium]|nr:hypothetical protein [Actinomycetota bacterium]
MPATGESQQRCPTRLTVALAAATAHQPNLLDVYARDDGHRHGADSADAVALCVVRHCAQAGFTLTRGGPGRGAPAVGLGGDGHSAVSRVAGLLPASPPATTPGCRRTTCTPEVSVLGAMLLSGRAIGEACELVDARDFYRAGTTASLRPSEPCITVASPPTRSPSPTSWNAAAGWATWGAVAIADLLQAVPTSAHAMHYARVVADQALLRRLVDAGTQVVSLGWEPSEEDAHPLVARARRRRAGHVLVQLMPTLSNPSSTGRPSNPCRAHSVGPSVVVRRSATISPSGSGRKASYF